jgi:HK97 family phage major capsid protein/HK97 family phage prohead protease
VTAAERVTVPSRAYSILDIKAVDEDRRIIEGIASTPSPDRVGDILDPKGADFKLPLPLLWQHRQDQPIGEVIEAKVTSDGIRIKAQIAKAGVADYIDNAWALMGAKLVRGLSVGWRATEPPKVSDGFFMFPKWLWLELSAVTIPANQDATITAIKSLDDAHLAAIGTGGTSQPAGAPARREPTRSRKVSITPVAQKTITEQIREFEANRETKRARLNELAAKSADEGVTLDTAEEEEYDTLDGEIQTINKHVQRLQKLEEHNKAAAVPANGKSADEAAKNRGGVQQIRVDPVKLPPGIGFARAVKSAVVARLDGRNMLDVAKSMYPSDTRLHGHITHVMNLPSVIAQLKAAVPAGTTTESTWASALVDPTNLPEEFIEYLRPATIIGKFGTGNIPALRSVPFNVRMIEQTQGGTGYWVGQGAPKPLTAFGFAPVTLGITKVAAIAVITEELARLSTPSADQLSRDGLRSALIERIDVDFIDPASAAVTNVQPASITNGLSALSSAGATADNARTDLAAIMAAFVSANLDPSGVVLIMPTTLALALSFQVNSLGQPEFPGLNMSGGSINGIPVITSQYAANASGGGNLVIAVNAREIFLADDGQVTVDASREASLQMLDNPTNNSSSATPTTMVSMWQNNSIALRAERFINWAKRRSDAVVYMDDVNWGSIGSP